MTQQFRTGDRVSWNSPQGRIVGKIVKHVHSHGEPHFEVRSDKTGATAVHKASALRPHS